MATRHRMARPSARAGAYGNSGAEKGRSSFGSLLRSLNSAAIEMTYMMMAPNTDMVTMLAVSGMPPMTISQSEKIATIPTTPPARMAQLAFWNRPLMAERDLGI